MLRRLWNRYGLPGRCRMGCVGCGGFGGLGRAGTVTINCCAGTFCRPSDTSSSW